MNLKWENQKAREMQMDHLSNEILQLILEKISTRKDFCAVILTCKKWKEQIHAAFAIQWLEMMKKVVDPWRYLIDMRVRSRILPRSSSKLRDRCQTGVAKHMLTLLQESESTVSVVQWPMRSAVPPVNGHANVFSLFPSAFHNRHLLLEYAGNMLDGQRHGKGKLDILDETARFSMSGTFVAGSLNGIGTIIEDEVTYVGDVLHGDKHGRGILQATDGMRYEGEFQKGKYHGRGKLSWPDGVWFEGEFEHGIPHGRGIQMLDGSRYEGEFRNGHPHGEGRRVHEAHGSIEEGEWRNGNLHGHGIVMKAGERYEGNFVEGFRCGQGIVYHPYNVTYRGEWDGDKIIRGVYSRGSQVEYEGEFGGDGDGWRPWSFHGQGKSFEHQEYTSEGLFENDLFKKGKRVYVGGNVFEGTPSKARVDLSKERPPTSMP